MLHATAQTAMGREIYILGRKKTHTLCGVRAGMHACVCARACVSM